MKIIFAVCALLLGVAGNLQALADESPAATLDALHRAGAETDQIAFVSLLTDDVVFLGLEDTQRLEAQSLRDFFNDSFSGGVPWAFQSSGREIQLSADGTVAWFDEILQSDQLGSGRGSGVLVHDSEGWKLTQYNLTLAQPDEGEVSTVVANPGEPMTENSTAVDTPAESTAADTGQTETPVKKRCRKMRHKTNKRASC